LELAALTGNRLQRGDRSEQFIVEAAQAVWDLEV